ncbi:N-acetylglucosamine kinase [Kitasatospora nipponensis]
MAFESRGGLCRGPALVGGVLAIDAGNSKTDVALVTRDGDVLGTARGPGFAPQDIGAESAVAGLAPLVAHAVLAADLDIAPTLGPLTSRLIGCLANADLPIEEQRLGDALRSRRWSEEVTVANDTFAVLRAGTTGDRGVAVVCGAGINCVGRRGEQTVRFPALGTISGDWGGGGDLALAAMWWASRAEDGRGPATTLAAAIARHFERPSARAVAEAVRLGTVTEADLHQIVPLLFAAADAGDPTARHLVVRQAEEIGAMACAALRRLGLLTEPTPLVLGGGVLAAGHPQLMQALDSYLTLHAPLAQPQVVTAPPIVGAALLGLDRLHRSDDTRAAAEKRLRDHYARR